MEYDWIDLATASSRVSDQHANPIWNQVNNNNAYNRLGLNPKSITTTPAGSAPVPEPATMILFGTGLAGLIGTRLRRKK